MSRARKPRIGRPPVDGEVASERVELRLTPAQMRTWERLARERGVSIKALVVEAVDLLGETDGERETEGKLADLGREVLALARDLTAREG